MEPWIDLLLPFALLLARISGFFAVLPIFSWHALPMNVRAAIAIVVTVSLAMVMPRPEYLAYIKPFHAAILIVQEILFGLALGIAANLIYSAVLQGARIAGQQMGLTIAADFDPTTSSGDEVTPMDTLFEMIFAVFFLTIGGHQLLIRIIASSYKAFPAASIPDIKNLTAGVLEAGVVMLYFALQLAAPAIAAFLILAFILGVLARIMPEMDILMMSLSLRIGVGLLIAAAMMPTLNAMTNELARWMARNLMV